MAKKKKKKKGLRRPTIKELGITKEQKALRNEVNKLAKRVNTSFNTLRSAGYFNMYASKQLIDKLSISKLDNFLSRKNDIIVHTYDINKLTILKDLLTKFIKSKSSTVKGINNIRREQTIELGLTLDIEPEESSRLLEIFEDENYLTIQDLVIPSDMWALIVEAKEYNYSQDKFIDLFEKNISTIPDDNFRNALQSIYDKYV